MAIPEAFNLGPLVLPTSAVAAAGIYLIAYLSGRLFLRADEEERKAFGDIVLSPLLPFLLAWKLSLLATDARDVFSDPRALLYGSGSTINFVIGLCVAAAWTGYRWHKAKPGKAAAAAALRALVAAAILSGLLIAGNSLVGGRDRGHPLPQVDLAAPDGGVWSLEDAKGSPVVLNFWASWCPPCRAEMPMLASMASDPRYSGVSFFAVNAAVMERNQGAGAEWLRENGIDIPLLLDPSGEALAVYGIEAFPTTLVTDARGNLVARKTGAVSRGWVAAALRKAERRKGDG